MYPQNPEIQARTDPSHSLDVQDLLNRCTRLLALSLAATRSENSTIASLFRACTSLQVLDLSCCRHITNASLTTLTMMSSLSALRTPPELSSESLEALVAALPNLRVVHTGTAHFDEATAGALVHSTAQEAGRCAIAMGAVDIQEGDSVNSLQSKTVSSEEVEGEGVFTQGSGAPAGTSSAAVPEPPISTPKPDSAQTSLPQVSYRQSHCMSC